MTQITSSLMRKDTSFSTPQNTNLAVNFKPRGSRHHKTWCHLQESYSDPPLLPKKAQVVPTVGIPNEVVASSTPCKWVFKLKRSADGGDTVKKYMPLKLCYFMTRCCVDSMPTFSNNPTTTQCFAKLRCSSASTVLDTLQAQKEERLWRWSWPSSILQRTIKSVSRALTPSLGEGHWAIFIMGMVNDHMAKYTDIPPIPFSLDL